MRLFLTCGDSGGGSLRPPYKNVYIVRGETTNHYGAQCTALHRIIIIITISNIPTFIHIIIIVFQYFGIADPRADER